MVPLDGDPASERVLPRTVALAQGLGSGLTLIHAADPEGNPRTIPLIEMLDYLEWVATQCRALGTACTTSIAIGDPVDVVLDEARRSNARYIALTTNDGSILRRWFPRSVTQDLLRDAPIPLLIHSEAVSNQSSGLEDDRGPIICRWTGPIERKSPFWTRHKLLAR